ncbi:hypothetical protein B0H14DRAFT_2586869 [Mycena olivaceomarginata]|nr:hypothetical protein B0H14DRAFT_2586869 [Mycena olivaceomarginata]
MAPVKNGFPVPGTTTVYDTSETIDPKNVPLNGGILIKLLILSVDPLVSIGIGVVLRSETAGVEAGAHVRGFLGIVSGAFLDNTAKAAIAHQEYIIAPDLTGLEVIKRDPRLHWSVYIGAAGKPGETAFMGWREYSNAKKGEVAYISTGAGPVGSMVIQLAKQDGLKVIASAGSDEKVKFMKEIGARYRIQLQDHRHIGIMSAGKRLTLPWSSQLRMPELSYNNAPLPMKNPGLIFAKCLHLHGFLILDIGPEQAAAFQAEVVPKLANGEFKFIEDVTRGLDKVGNVLLAVQKGTNTGKAVVLVAEK